MSFWAICLTAIAALVAVFAYVEWSQRRHLRWPSDKECVEIMRQDGVDLSQPRMLEFWLDFPSRDLASKAIPEATAQGFEASVSGGGPGSPQPLLVVRKQLIPATVELAQVRERLTPLARKYGGSYRGCFPRG